MQESMEVVLRGEKGGGGGGCLKKVEVRVSPRQKEVVERRINHVTPPGKMWCYHCETFYWSIQPSFNPSRTPFSTNNSSALSSQPTNQMSRDG